MKRAGRVAVVTVLVIAGAAGVVAGILGPSTASAQSAYLTEQVARSTVTKSLSVSGTLVDDLTYAVAPGADPVLTLRQGQTVGRAVDARGYRTSKLLVATGDRVKSGDLLAKVEDPKDKTVKVKAPYDGIVRSVPTAKKADAAQIATLGVGQRKVVVTVSEYEVSRLEINQNVALELNANQKSFDGTVQDIAAVGETVAGVQKYRVVIKSTSVPSGALVNMTVSANITITSTTAAISVPLAAITETGGASSVELLDSDGNARRQAVQVGLVGDTRAEITKGLSVGDPLITGTAPTSSTGGFSRPAGAPGAGN